MEKFLICKSSEMDLTEAPALVRLLPMGYVTSDKGNFLVDQESYLAMKRHMEKHGVDLVIDYEHQTLQDVQAPAAGWIKELLVQDGVIAAKVEWTPGAAQYLRNKEYRYLSPVVRVNQSTGKAMLLHSAALTNTPAIDGMYTIAGKQTYDNDEGEQQTMELLEYLAQLLGLGADAGEEQIKEALRVALEEGKSLKAAAQECDKMVANKTVCEMLGLKAGAATEDVAAKIQALSVAKAPGFDTEGEMKALKAKLADRDAEDAVMLALKGGKLSPAMKDWAKTYALKDPIGFAGFLEKAPQVVPLGELEPDFVALKTTKPDDATLLICKQMGVSAEDVQKFGKEG